MLPPATAAPIHHLCFKVSSNPKVDSFRRREAVTISFSLEWLFVDLNDAFILDHFSMIYVLLHVDIYDSSCFFARFWLHSNNAQLKVNTVDVCLKQVSFDNSNVLSLSYIVAWLLVQKAATR